MSEEKDRVPATIIVGIGVGCGWTVVGVFTHTTPLIIIGIAALIIGVIAAIDTQIKCEEKHESGNKSRNR